MDTMRQRTAIGRSLQVFVCLAACASLSASFAQAEDLLETFTKARPALQRKLRSRVETDRVKGVNALREYPLADAVRLLMPCLSDEDTEVRFAAYEALLSMNGEQEVCDTLIDLCRKHLQDPKTNDAVPAMLAALLSSNAPVVQRSVKQLLEEKIAASPQGAEVAVHMADGLGLHGAPEDVLPLSRLSKSTVFAEHFGVRRAVVQSLMRIPTKESVSALIGMLDRVGGEARAEAADYLSKVTGEAFGMSAAGWASWWTGAEAKFVYPGKGQKVPVRTFTMVSENGSYYGLPLYAERVVFVLDTSGSMNGPRIDAAKREVCQTIAQLPEKVRFGIVVFNAGAVAWKKELVPATTANKGAATAYILNRTTSADTASYTALELALTFDTEAVYFVTDGAPTTGKFVAPVDIVNAIGAINKTLRVSIYTIGIAPGLPGGPCDEFLRVLAEKNSGKYSRIDR